VSDEIFPFVYQEKFLFYSGKDNNGKLSPKLAINSVDVRWSVMDLSPPFTSEQDDFSFSVDENLDYGLLSSNRETGKGDDDLYAFKFKPQMAGLEDEYSFNPIDTLIVSQDGVLKNDETSMLSQDPLTILFRKEAVLVENTINGTLQLNANGSFLYKNIAPTKEKDSFAYVLKSKYGTSKKIKVLLQRSEVAIEKLSDSIKKTFLPIFYSYDKSNLLVDYKDRIDAVVSAMNARPEMIVELSSFSDCRGRREYNLKLSQERTQTIIEYVGERIDNKDRIFGKGYGEDSVSGNTTLDYLILGGSYTVYDNALLKQKIFNALGYKAEIEKINKGLYRIIVEQTNSYAEAQKSVQALNQQQQKVWIKSCECCSLSEVEHLQNRRTDFKIVHY
jgi:outer membrane protein OmpA-like peptidoglycan-associated protein